MRCLGCNSAAVTERLERTAQGYRRFRCRECGRQFNERSTGLLNRTQYPSDVIALVVLWRLRYKLSLRDLAEMFLIRGIVFSHEAVRDWRRNSPRLWPKNSVAADIVASAGAGMLTRRTSRFTATGAISIGPSTAMVPLLT
jgi:transposase-like protein